MAPKELKTLRLLMEHPTGLFGAELIALSEGMLGRGTIYVVLDRLIDKGFVREEEVSDASGRPARVRHLITGEGARAVEQFAQNFGFILPGSRQGGVFV